MSIDESIEESQKEKNGERFPSFFFYVMIINMRPENGRKEKLNVQV